MPIKPTAAGGYEVSVCVRRRRLHRRLPPGTSARDAKRAESELRLALERETKRPSPIHISGDPPLVEVMGLYLQAAAHLRSPDTARHHAVRIGPWVAKYRASQARQCAASIIADMQGHYAPATINRSLGTLKRALRLAWEQGLVLDDHSAAVRRLPEHNQRDTYLTMDQVATLAGHASEQVRAAIWIALLTGCRRGEVLSMTPAAIGADAITIRAGNTKILRTRSVPIIPALRPWLALVPLKINAEGLKTGFRRAREAAGPGKSAAHEARGAGEIAEVCAHDDFARAGRGGTLPGRPWGYFVTRRSRPRPRHHWRHQRPGSCCRRHPTRQRSPPTRQRPRARSPGAESGQPASRQPSRQRPPASRRRWTGRH